jgi:eukaryotic-like serine/threonine-protein kinase
MKLDGVSFGPYEIVGVIGAGGMGEVWKARDTRLSREVAIKILPAEFASNAQLHARFDREAQAISRLEHPNICRLYDVGETNDVSTPAGSAPALRYLVMEYLDGESLADRLRKGPLPTAEVLRYGQQIASALEAAHRKGIVHRDLKPGNVMITRSGAKLLDFGLAKSSATTPAGEDATAHKPLTHEGMVLGTWQYMAPEQLTGGESDSRTDIFALGALLYEMATGEPAFAGKSRTSIVAAILSGEPRPLRQLQPLTPPALEHLIGKCLQKEPEARWQSANDIADELSWISDSGSQAGLAVPLQQRRTARERLGWAMNLLTAAVAIGATWWVITSRAPAPLAVEASIEIPAVHRVALNSGMAVSPDGRTIAAALDDMRGSRMLWLRPVDGTSFRRLEGTDDAAYPFWSPDSRQIAFFATGQLKVIDAAGGVARVICNAPGPRGGAWNRSGTILFSGELEAPLMKVDSRGGAPQPATRLEPGERGHRWPWFLGDGEHFLYVTMNAPGRGSGIYRGTLRDPNERTFVSNAQTSMAVAAGHLLYGLEGAVVAQKFEARRGRVSGSAVPVIDGVPMNDRLQSLFSVGGSILIAQRGPGFIMSQLVWVDRNGQRESVVAGRDLFFSPRLSRDGRRLAVDRSNQSDGQGDLWSYDLSRNVATRLTFELENESGPWWTPDDRYIIYHRGNQGSSLIQRVASGGTGQAETLVESAEEKRLTHVSSDGQWFFFDQLSGMTMSDIWLYSVAEGTARPWLSTPFNERGAELSPDGRWIAYQSDESGRNEIYVRNFPESDRKWLVTTSGGTMPAWRSDGRELFYISNDGQMMSLAITAREEFETSPPVPLFEARVRSHALRQYDVSSDGSRFLLNLVDESPSQPLTLLSNWPSRLRR